MATITERLADLASSRFLDTARVTGAGRLSEHVVTVELRCEAFRTAEWVPGAKLQLRPRRGTWGMRTYSPFDPDPERGTVSLVAYTHGDGPGSEWFSQVGVGDDCELTGPRRSVDLRGLGHRVLFVGDESSVGLACALRSQAAEATHVFESTDPDELRSVLHDLDVATTAVVVPRTDDHAPLLEAATRAEVSAPFDLVVTGDASGVHAVRRHVRGWAHQPEHVTGKAYWARGRTGLD